MVLISLGYNDIQRAKVNFDLDKNNIRQNSQIHNHIKLL